MENDKVAKRIQAKRKKIQLHERKTKERKEDAAGLKAAYLAAKDDTVLKDILTKLKSFAAYHVKMAQDGVGYRSTGAKLEDGSPEQELFYFTPEQRVSHLDKSAGQLELIDYIERQLTIPEVVPSETVNPTTAE